MPRNDDEHKVTADDPICQCGLQKHDHFGGTGGNAVRTPSGQDCNGFKLDAAATRDKDGKVL
jgi:hypothetical protein